MESISELRTKVFSRGLPRPRKPQTTIPLFRPKGLPDQNPQAPVHAPFPSLRVLPLASTIDALRRVFAFGRHNRRGCMGWLAPSETFQKQERVRPRPQPGYFRAHAVRRTPDESTPRPGPARHTIGNAQPAKRPPSSSARLARTRLPPAHPGAAEKRPPFGPTPLRPRTDFRARSIRSLLKADGTQAVPRVSSLQQGKSP